VDKAILAACSKKLVARRKKKPSPTRIKHTRGFGFFAATQPAGIFQQAASQASA
jgi:hypothetical protein